MKQKFTIKDIKESIAAAFVLLLIIFVAVDFFAGKSAREPGTLVEKVFIPERTYVGTRSYTDDKGRSRSQLSIERDPAEWTIYVQSLAGRVVRIRCSPEVFYSVSKGQTVVYGTRYGRISHFPYFRRAINGPVNTHQPNQAQEAAASY